jgi:hypothetical protein
MEIDIGSLSIWMSGLDFEEPTRRRRRRTPAPLYNVERRWRRMLLSMWKIRKFGAPPGPYSCSLRCSSIALASSTTSDLGYFSISRSRVFRAFALSFFA